MDIIDTLTLIFSFLSYKNIADTTIKVSKFWHDVSQKQLKIRHQAGNILPIIHNRQTQDQFIHCANKIFKDYILQKQLILTHFINNINRSRIPGDNLFIKQLYPFDEHQIKNLYAYVILKIYSFDFINNDHKFHQFPNANSIFLFDKLFTCYMYLRKFISGVAKPLFNVCASDFDFYFIYWDVSKIPDGVFND